MLTIFNNYLHLQHNWKDYAIQSVFDLYDTIEEFNVDSKAEYSALSSTRSQKKKLRTN